ncbi:MAG: ATP synthase F1 subunit delta, partial [Proteobacteria bacterium]|nr:ATP synthase F1 subunit delta [Pseudomonadota bacterium]
LLRLFTRAQKLTSSNIAKRYARAFFKVAKEERRYEDYSLELGRFSAILKENKGLNEFLANPIFARQDKKAVVETILQKTGISELTANFLKLLVDKRRIGIISDIESRYRELMYEALNKVKVTVSTAFPLTGELAAQLQEGLEKLTGKQVEMTVLLDPSLLGGVVVRIGDTLYDSSIRTQLNKIKDLLGEEM